jgi:UrcA family protein
MILTWRHSRSPDDRRSDMTSSQLRFGFPLAIVLATASAAAVAQQTNQTPDFKIEAGKVQETVKLSYDGVPMERLQVDVPVSYANLDLTTTSGAAELEKRVAEAAKAACEKVDGADPFNLSDTDDTDCVRTATNGAMKRVKAVITAARTNSPSGSES